MSHEKATILFENFLLINSMHICCNHKSCIIVKTFQLNSLTHKFSDVISVTLISVTGQRGFLQGLHRVTQEAVRAWITTFIIFQIYIGKRQIRIGKRNVSSEEHPGGTKGCWSCCCSRCCNIQFLLSNPQEES